MLQSGTLDAEKRAQSALASSPIYALRDIRVEESDDGQLILIGHVDTFYHKQVAQEVVRAVASGRQIVNSIAVED
jgi:hypothetical protein